MGPLSNGPILVKHMKLTLNTQKLLLRPFEVGDDEAMFSGWANDPEVTRYLTWNPHESVEKTRLLIERWTAEYEKPERLNFAIELKATGELIGGIDVCGYLGGVNGVPVIGYVLAKKHWGNGYMTEALTRVLELLFSRGYDMVRVDAMPENIGSIRVIQKCGGEYIGTEDMERPLKNDTVKVNMYEVKSKRPGR